MTSNWICGHHFQESHGLNVRMCAREQLFPGHQMVNEPLWDEHRKIKIRIICSEWNKASYFGRGWWGEARGQAGEQQHHWTSTAWTGPSWLRKQFSWVVLRGSPRLRKETGQQPDQAADGMGSRGWTPTGNNRTRGQEGGSVATGCLTDSFVQHHRYNAASSLSNPGTPEFVKVEQHVLGWSSGSLSLLLLLLQRLQTTGSQKVPHHMLKPRTDLGRGESILA